MLRTPRLQIKQTRLRTVMSTATVGLAGKAFGMSATSNLSEKFIFHNFFLNEKKLESSQIYLQS